MWFCFRPSPRVHTLVSEVKMKRPSLRRVGMGCQMCNVISTMSIVVHVALGDATGARALRRMQRSDDTLYSMRRWAPLASPGAPLYQRVAGAPTYEAVAIFCRRFDRCRELTVRGNRTYQR